MKLPRNPQSRSKSRQKCLQVQKQVLVSVGVDRANLRRVRLLLHLPGVSSGPTRSTQSTDVAAARPRTASANVQSAATAAARNPQEAWRGAAAAPLTRSPATSAADERHWEEQVSPRRQTDRIRASRSPLSHPEKKLKGREAPFKLLFLRQRESAAPHHRSPPQTSPTLLSASLSSSHSPDACCRLAPPSTGGAARTGSGKCARAQMAVGRYTHMLPMQTRMHRARISGNNWHNLVTYKSVRVARLPARGSFKD